MNRDRCFDCLEEIKATDRRFVVRKTLLPNDKIPSQLVGFNEVQECVCKDCAGWYSDALELDEWRRGDR